MILSSRPLRFMGAVIGGWVGLRAAMLWPVGQAIIHAVAPAAAAEVVTTAYARSTATVIARTDLPARIAAGPMMRPRPAARTDTADAVEQLHAAPADRSVPTAAPKTDTEPPAPRLAGVDPPPAFELSRWSGSAWAIVRPEGRATPFASQLGGSQAGARLAFAVDAARRVAVYARVSTAIDAREKEAAVGLDWRPTRAPVHLIAERRIGIEGVRGGTAVGAVGGVGRTRVAGPVQIEGYAQGGVIFRDGQEGYADGSVRLTVPARTRIDLGVGAWGGAQRGAARLDVGPTIGVSLPVERHALRLSVDWRQRVAGDARPGSGPALSLGTDF